MNTAEILKKVRKIEIKTRRLSDNLFGGEYHSHFKGRGMTFSEVRQYQYGDDIRNIDWNVTARHNDAFVKVFEEERELTMMLLVDVSGSEFFGTKAQFKRNTLTEIAATLAFSAIQNNDKVGLVLFSGTIELYIPPKKGRSHVLRIIRELIEFKPQNAKTSINKALKFLSSIMKKKAIVFLLSDFMDEDYEKSLQIAGKKHDITGIQVFDIRDKEIPNIGLVPVLDAETGKTHTINTASKKVRNNHRLFFEKNTDYFIKQFHKIGAGVIRLKTEEDYVKKLLGFFKQK